MFRKQEKSKIFRSQKSSGFLRNHFCEFEVAGELVFCKVCGEQPRIRGGSR